eukprot:gb/GECG01003017.1/.p1 GENE.gb/GECG01003017.1/~~gb/GECG01003017.1/.p1  ORF type:complete len:473 (+),score=29.55 gb/GECG01003017.1/:1-1419(+)
MPTEHWHTGRQWSTVDILSIERTSTVFCLIRNHKTVHSESIYILDGPVQLVQPYGMHASEIIATSQKTSISHFVRWLPVLVYGRRGSCFKLSVLSGHAKSTSENGRMQYHCRRFCSNAANSRGYGRVFSAIQPTGVPHLGNYLGALRQWRLLQEQENTETIFAIADLHSLTVESSPSQLREQSRMTAASLLACGIQPSKSIFFRQSTVPAHSELMWLFSCISPLGKLRRMTQFKQKLQKTKGNSADQKMENVNLGLLSYPVLQAADILIYKATSVPVGDDQRQHLELAREIALTFNDRFCKPNGRESFFPLPSTLTAEELPGGVVRVMSLRNGTAKMSKSEASDMSRINLTDNQDTIFTKIRKARTDAMSGPLTYDPEQRPERANLLNLFSVLDPRYRSTEELVNEFRDKDSLTFKNALAEVVAETICPIGTEIEKLMADPAYLDQLLEEGERRAREVAQNNIKEAKALVGL